MNYSENISRAPVAGINDYLETETSIETANLSAHSPLDSSFSGFVPPPQAETPVTLPRPSAAAAQSQNVNTDQQAQQSLNDKAAFQNLVHQEQEMYKDQSFPQYNEDDSKQYFDQNQYQMGQQQFQEQQFFSPMQQPYPHQQYFDPQQKLQHQQQQQNQEFQNVQAQQSTQLPHSNLKKELIEQAPMEKTVMDSMIEDDRSNKRCMYLCIPVNKKSRYICLGVTFLVLLVLGIVIGLFYPRLPNFQVLSINPVSANSYQLSNFDKTNPNSFKFTMSMVMNVSVVNTNAYHLKIDKMDLTTFVNANGTAINNANPSPAAALFGIQGNRVYVTSSNYQNQIGTGSFGSIIFPSNVNTTFTMNLNINYTPGPLGALNDPTLNEMIQLCVESVGDSPRRATIAYSVVNSVGILKYIGYNPTIQGSIKIRCPFQGAAQTAFINALSGKGGIN